MRFGWLGGRWFWPCAATILLCLSTFNWWERSLLNSQTEAAKQGRERITSDTLKRESALAALVGRRLRWPDDLKQVGDVDTRGGTSTGYRLVALLGDVECNTQRNAVTVLLRRIVSTAPSIPTAGNRVTAVISVTDPKVARSYSSGNQFRFSVLVDSRQRFAESNLVRVVPVVLVTDRADIVVAAVSPVGISPNTWEALSDGVVRLLTSEGSSTVASLD